MRNRQMCVQWTAGYLMILVLMATGIGATENLGRGFTAIRADAPSVFLTWRRLTSDADDVTFSLVRTTTDRKGVAQGKGEVLAEGLKTTCYFDKNAIRYAGVTIDALYEYQLRLDSGADKNKVVARAVIDGPNVSPPYLRIPLQGDYDVNRVGVGDLDGDGELEYLIRQPNFNTDPYQQPGYWKRSTTTYKLEAYRADGTMLWRYDMGWAIEAGAWYAPWIVYDVDGDGKAEVYCKAGEGDPREKEGHVKTGPEYLVKLDGLTGKILAKTDWPDREGFRDYNRYCRNFLAVAYLDGKTPSIVIQRGTYGLIKMLALDKDFHKIWYWDTTQETGKYGAQSGHGLTSADVDGDGRDELVMGAAVIDDNGKGLWTLGIGHPDAFYVADILPSRPGLEIFYGIEPRQQKNGLCVVSAKTGEIIWGHGEPTHHVHSQGMAGDILADYEGMEVFAGERDFPIRWLYSAKGELIETFEKMTLTPRPVWWDGDPLKEVVIGNVIVDWDRRDEPIQKLEGKQVAVMDVVGDWREEVVTSLNGELRIYVSTIPTDRSRTTLMQDRQYRLGVTAQTMGYYYPAQLGETAP